MPTISVIVPVYKVEKYLDKCVASILNQTHTDIEVILVDDGSPDNCGVMCDEWASKDTRIHVIHKENGGISSARNRGLDEAKGEFISFIDSDDYVETNMLEVLYKGLIDNDADVSVCGVYNVYDSFMRPQTEGIKEFICDGVTAYRKLLEGVEIPAALWNKLYKRETIGGLRFPLGKIYEDAFFFADFMPRVKKVWVTTKPLYYYIHRNKSLMTEPFNMKALDAIDAYLYNMKIIEDKYPHLKEQGEFRLYWAYFSVLDRMLLKKKYKKIPEYGAVVDVLKKNWLSILRNRYFTKGRKIGEIFLKINIKIYRKILLIKQEKEKLL